MVDAEARRCYFYNFWPHTINWRVSVQAAVEDEDGLRLIARDQEVRKEEKGERRCRHVRDGVTNADHTGQRCARASESRGG